MALQLLHYSDLEIAYDDPESIGRLATAIERERTPETVVIGTGDNTAPGALPLARGGRQARTFFEAVDADVDTLGNHDFDFGVARAREHVRETPQTWVAANAYEPVEPGEGAASESTEPAATNASEPTEMGEGTDAGDGEAGRPGALDRFASEAGLVPWTVVETRSYRVGVVGVAHPDTDRMNPLAADLRFEAAQPAAERAIEAVREHNVDALVLAAHVGSGRADGPSGRDLAAHLDVDVVLDGHDHDSTVDRAGDGTIYVRPGKGADTLVAVEMDAEEAVRRIPTEAYEPDDALVEALVEQARAAGLTERVGHLPDPIDCSREAVDAGESRIGNLVTDAFRTAADADVAMIAPEGIRAQDPLAGELTVWDLHALVPFDGDVLSLSVRGDRLEAALEALQFDRVHGAPDWMCGHVSGARLVYDGATLQQTAVDGNPLDPDRQYRLATSEYYVRNEDLFPSLSPADVIARHGPQYEVITDYVRGIDRVPEIEGRITRS